MVESKKLKKRIFVFTQGIFPQNFVAIRQGTSKLWASTDADDDADDDDADGQKVTA